MSRIAWFSLWAVIGVLFWTFVFVYRFWFAVVWNVFAAIFLAMILYAVHLHRKSNQKGRQ